MDKYDLLKKIFSLDSQRMSLENRLINLNDEIQNALKLLQENDIGELGHISEETRLVLETFKIQENKVELEEKEKFMQAEQEVVLKLIPINSSMRYDENGNRLWFGKTPEQFSESDKMGFLVSNELELNGKLSKETEMFLEENGYKFHDQKLYKIDDGQEKHRSSETENKENFQQHCRGYAYVKGQQKPHILHANTPEEIVMRLQNWNKTRPADMQFKVVNIGSLDNQQNKYVDYHKYEVATGKDISSVYLELPKMNKEEFLQTVSYLKENGAKYLPNSKKWYITADMDQTPFERFLTNKRSEQVVNMQPESTKEYSLLLSKDVEANECMVAFHDGREPITLHGDQFGVNFAQFKTPDEVVEIVDDYIKKQMTGIKEENLDLSKLQAGDKLECYVPEFSEEGFCEITKMVKMEATIEKIGKNDMYFFSDCSLPDYSTGASKSTLFSESQANVINRTIEAQVAPEFIRIMANSELTVGQMDVISAAAKDGFLAQQIQNDFIDVSEKFLPAPDMDMMRIGLQNGVEKKAIQGICSQERSWADKRQLLNGEIKKTEEKVGQNFKKQGYPINRETARKVIQLNHCTHQKNKLEDIATAYKNQTFKDSNPKAQRLINDISKECQMVAMAQHQCSV